MKYSRMAFLLVAACEGRVIRVVILLGMAFGLISCASVNITPNHKEYGVSEDVRELLNQSYIVVDRADNFSNLRTSDINKIYNLKQCFDCQFFVSIKYEKCKLLEHRFSDYTWPLSFLTLTLYPFHEKWECQSEITVEDLKKVKRTEKIQQDFRYYLYAPLFIPIPVEPKDMTYEVDEALQKIIKTISKEQMEGKR